MPKRKFIAGMPVNEYKREYYQKVGKSQYKRDRTWLLNKAKERRRQQRHEMMVAYGYQCSCCGNSQPEFLTIDHINNDGAEHRRQLNSGDKMVRWLRDHNYPKNGFQLLCSNCNCSKGFHGYCPHEAWGILGGGVGEYAGVE